MEIDFTRLRYFVTVAEELHFKRAADRLLITPPPLSKQIKLLERELGGELFERHYHEVRLTPLGAVLLPEAQAILEQLEKFKEVAENVAKQRKPLRIGMTAYAPSDFLQAFETAVETISVDAAATISGSASDVTAQLVAGHLDLGLIHLPTTDDRLHTEVIARHLGAVAVRADDPIAQHDQIRIEELADREILIDYSRPNPQLLAHASRRLNELGLTKLVHSVTTRSSELEMANHAYNQHLAVLVSYAPDSIVGKMFSAPQFKLVRLDPATWEPGALALAWTAERARRDPRITLAIRELKAAVEPFMAL
jgi:DNA-binding transcriptional LysR family regulator